MDMKNPFPDCYLDDPTRQAELRVYRAFEEDERPGVIIYSVTPPGGTEIDYIALIRGEHRMAIELKGGPHQRRDHEWYRTGREGEEKIDDPMKYASKKGMKLLDYLRAKEPDQLLFVVSVLLFPDMPAGHDLEGLSSRQCVVVCGTEDLVNRIIRSVRSVHIDHRAALTEDDCEREAALLVPDTPAIRMPGKEGDCERQEAPLVPDTPVICLSGKVEGDAVFGVLTRYEFTFNTHIHMPMPPPRRSRRRRRFRAANRTPRL